MNLQYFPQFFRINYPKVEASNEEISEIGIEFKKYLEKTFEGSMEKLEPIWGINPHDVITNMGHPFRTNGYHPELIIHFGQFVNKMKNEPTED